MDQKAENYIINLFDDLRSALKEKMEGIEKHEDVPSPLTYWDGHLTCAREFYEWVAEKEQKFVEERLAEETKELTE